MHQDELEWEAPSSGLPQQFVDSVEFMFENGLADPRGGEYRSVTITVNSSWKREEKQIETMGWVFPKSSVNPQYVVCWDGLIYLPDKVGAKQTVS